MYPWGKTCSQNKDLSQCDIAISQIRGPQKILCTFGEKEHTSKRVSIIACNNVISKVQCATHRPEGIPFDDKTSRNGVWLDVKIMRKNAGFRARIYYLYNKIG